MKPKRLKIKGLNSFKDTQIIEFDKLTSKGLFGIFGPTGSGKSSILDAIVYALYGKIIRHKAGFINLTEDKAEVSYEFEIGLGEDRKTYIAQRTAKKDKKSDKGSYSTAGVRLIEVLKDGGNKIIEEGNNNVNNKIKEIIGLTFEDFTRAVVLPQDKFSQFLQTAPSERSDMLERIFGLEKYGRGLQQKISVFASQNRQEKSILQGKLSQFEGISKEDVERVKSEFEVLKNEEETISKEKVQIDEKYNKYKIIWELQNELKGFDKSYKELIENSAVIEESKLKLDNGRHLLIIKPSIDAYEDTKNKIKANNIEIIESQEQLQKLQEELKTIEAEYKKASDEKNNKIPELVRIQANLKQAIVIKRNIDMLIKDIKNSEDKLKNISEETLKKEQILENLAKDKINIENESKKISEAIEQNSILPEIREKVHQGFLDKKKYLELLQELENIEIKRAKIRNQLDAAKEQNEKVTKFQAEKDKAIENLKLSIENIMKNCPGDKDSLIKMVERINELKIKYKEAAENFTKLKELKDKKLHSEEGIKKAETALTEMEEKIKLLNKELKEITSEKERLITENLANALAQNLKHGEMCPVCGSTNHPNPLIHDGQKNFEELIKLSQNAENKKKEDIDKLQIDINQYKIEIMSHTSKIKELNEEILVLEQKLREADIEKIKTEGIQAETEYKKTKTDIEKWEAYKAESDKRLEVLKEDKAKQDTLSAKLSESIKKDEEALKEILKQIDEISKASSEFSVNVSRIEKELGILDINEKEKDIKQKDKNNEILKKNNQLIQQKLSVVREEIEKAALLKNNLMQEKAKYQQSIKEKSETAQKQRAEMLELAGEKEPEEYITAVEENIKAINLKEQNLKDKFNNKNQQKQNSEKTSASLLKSKEDLAKLEEEQAKIVESMLSEYNFKNIEYALTWYVKNADLDKIEKEIKDYEEKLNNCKNNIERINSKLKGDSVEEAVYIEFQNKKSEIENLINIKREERAKKQKELEDIELKAAEMKTLLKEQEKILHKESLLSELEKLVKGNKLVAFVASSQLKYVALEASKMLKKITKGKYALEISDDSSFVIRDDNNGGERRDTHSLSGGETFLTSLALALSLSSHIQLKGKAPLEFFFLDEGFGTLDPELLELVINSLESLHSDRLSVGIISHVEELKNRVPIKLLVSPAKNGEGSIVRIENT